jgi:hypothetical protein
MAMTVSNVVVSALPGGRVLVAGNATGDTSYATGGETMDLSSYLLTGSTPIIVLCGDDGYVPQSDRGTAAANLVLVYEAGADAAAAIFTFIAIGQTP